MAGKVLLVVFRTVIGLALIAAGFAIEFLQYRPGLMPSVQIGNAIVGPILSFIGVILALWPAVTWFYRSTERYREEMKRGWRVPTKDEKPDDRPDRG